MGKGGLTFGSDKTSGSMAWFVLLCLRCTTFLRFAFECSLEVIAGKTFGLQDLAVVLPICLSWELTKTLSLDKPYNSSSGPTLSQILLIRELAISGVYGLTTLVLPAVAAMTKIKLTLLKTGCSSFSNRKTDVTWLQESCILRYISLPGLCEIDLYAEPQPK